MKVIVLDAGWQRLDIAYEQQTNKLWNADQISSNLKADKDAKYFNKSSCDVLLHWLLVDKKF